MDVYITASGIDDQSLENDENIKFRLISVGLKALRNLATTEIPPGLLVLLLYVYLLMGQQVY